MCIRPGSLPNIAYVRGSNYCDLGLVSDPRTGRVIVVCGHRQSGQGRGRTGGAEHEYAPRSARDDRARSFARSFRNKEAASTLEFPLKQSPTSLFLPTSRPEMAVARLG